MTRVPISILIPTFNEELNLPYLLKNVVGWAEEVFVVDSLSTDNTVHICKEFDVPVYPHAFENYSLQKNWALDTIPFTQDWIFILDSDEYLCDTLKLEIESLLARTEPVPEAGFYVNRRFIFMGKWLRHGGLYPSWLLRMFRRGKGRYEKRSVNEHLLVEGTTGTLKGDIIHDDHKGLSDWLNKHVRYSSMEADELLAGKRQGNISMSFFGSQAERKRFLRYRIWNHLPFRGLLHFFYKYVLRLGFLDGLVGFRFALLIAQYEYWMKLQVLEKKRLASKSE